MELPAEPVLVSVLEVEDWLATQRGGPDMNLVFEAANGANLDTVRVPGFFTYEGFYAGLLAH